MNIVNHDFAIVLNKKHIILSYYYLCIFLIINISYIETIILDLKNNIFLLCIKNNNVILSFNSLNFIFFVQ